MKLYRYVNEAGTSQAQVKPAIGDHVRDRSGNYHGQVKAVGLRYVRVSVPAENAGELSHLLLIRDAVVITESQVPGDKKSKPQNLDGSEPDALASYSGDRFQ